MTAPEPVTVEPVSPVAPALRGTVMMNQDWRDVTMVHWAVPPARVAHLMPPGVRPDAHEGRTYVGLVPFRMVDAAPRHGGGVPWLGSFLETNIRLYSVDATGRRGIVFLSLDCDRLAVVAGARAVFGLPYRWARMRHVRVETASGDQHLYTSRLRGPGPRERTRVAVRVGPPSGPSELDHFLTARWGLHNRWLGGTRYIANEHPPWPLHEAELLDLDDELLGSVGLGDLRGRTPDQVAFSPGVHTEFGLPRDARHPRVSGQRPPRRSDR